MSGGWGRSEVEVGARFCLRRHWLRLGVGLGHNPHPYPHPHPNPNTTSREGRLCGERGDAASVDGAVRRGEGFVDPA